MSVTAARGFVAAGGHGGLKADGAPDLAIVATADGQAVPAAGVFTANKMTAAPVLVSRTHLTQSSGQAAAVILNSGNANAATGEPGSQDAEELCAHVAQQLGCAHDQVLVCSTGLIGYRLPLEAMVAAVPGAGRRSGRSPATATPLRPSSPPTRVRKEVVVDGGGLHRRRHGQGGGHAGPEHGDDAGRAHHRRRGRARRAPAASCAAAVADTFNCIIVDGCHLDQRHRPAAGQRGRRPGRR